MAYPSTLSTYTDPSPTDRLSTTPHSSIETAQNTGLREIQAFIGTLSSTAGTLIYDIRAAASNGGGHVQTVNKGGTGQTSYTKGDLLVATSASVLTKLAAGNDADILTADSSVASGVKWNPGVNSQAIQNMQFSNGTETGSGSVYSISPVPCVLSYVHGQLFTFQAATANTVASPTLTVSSLAGRRIVNPDGTVLTTGQIPASAMTMVQYQGSASVFHLLSQKNGYSEGTGRSGLTSSSIVTGGGPISPSWSNLRAISSTLVTATTVTPTKFKEIALNRAGTFAVGFELRITGASGSVTGRIYTNGSPSGTNRISGSTTFTDYVEALSFSKGDLVQLYAATSGGDTGEYRNFRIMGSPEDVGTWNTE